MKLQPTTETVYDTVTYWLNIAYFCYSFATLSHSAPSLPVFPLEFRAEVNRQETRVMGLMAILQ